MGCKLRGAPVDSQRENGSSLQQQQGAEFCPRPAQKGLWPPDGLAQACETLSRGLRMWAPTPDPRKQTLSMLVALCSTARDEDRALSLLVGPSVI